MFLWAAATLFIPPTPRCKPFAKAKPNNGLTPTKGMSGVLWEALTAVTIVLVLEMWFVLQQIMDHGVAQKQRIHSDAVWRTTF